MAGKKKAASKRAPRSTAVIKVSPTAARSRGRVRSEGTEFPVPPLTSELPADYPAALSDLKQLIAKAQARAALAVTGELIGLYWRVGKTIVQRQAHAGWGTAVVERLAFDLRQAFPGLEGFSPRNIWRMRQFYLAWSMQVTDTAVSESRARGSTQRPPRVVAELPWGHNIVLLQQVDDHAAQRWYAEAARTNGWSRSVLQAQITKRAHARQGKAATNFTRALGKPHAALAEQALKDPYNFDFLTVGRKASERVVERELLLHIRDFLLELGAGFAFIGSQVKLVVGGTGYFLDLLFYHVKLRAHVVVELKATAFKPEHAGQMNFYLAAVDDLLKHPEDQPTIGLLLCKSRDRLRVEYALRSIAAPIGVAEYQTKLLESLPKSLEGSLPTVEEIEAELGGGGRAKKRRSSRSGRNPSRGGA